MAKIEETIRTMSMMHTCLHATSPKTRTLQTVVDQIYQDAKLKMKLYFKRILRFICSDVESHLNNLHGSAFKLN